MRPIRSNATAVLESIPVTWEKSNTTAARPALRSQCCSTASTMPLAVPKKR
jgi:hypothetical protein